jgi:cation transport ATPase
MMSESAASADAACCTRFQAGLKMFFCPTRKAQKPDIPNEDALEMSWFDSMWWPLIHCALWSTTISLRIARFWSSEVADLDTIWVDIFAMASVFVTIGYEIYDTQMFAQMKVTYWRSIGRMIVLTVALTAWIMYNLHFNEWVNPYPDNTEYPYPRTLETIFYVSAVLIVAVFRPNRWTQADLPMWKWCSKKKDTPNEAIGAHEMHKLVAHS